MFATQTELLRALKASPETGVSRALVAWLQDLADPRAWDSADARLKDERLNDALKPVFRKQSQVTGKELAELEQEVRSRFYVPWSDVAPKPIMDKRGELVVPPQPLIARWCWEANNKDRPSSAWRFIRDHVRDIARSGRRFNGTSLDEELPDVGGDPLMDGDALKAFVERARKAPISADLWLTALLRGAGYSVEDISRAMGVSAGTVSKKYNSFKHFTRESADESEGSKKARWLCIAAGAASCVAVLGLWLKAPPPKVSSEPTMEAHLAPPSVTAESDDTSVETENVPSLATVTTAAGGTTTIVPEERGSEAEVPSAYAPRPAPPRQAVAPRSRGMSSSVEPGRSMSGCEQRCLTNSAELSQDQRWGSAEEACLRICSGEAATVGHPAESVDVGY